MTPDSQLLADYAVRRDETAFAEFVRRHLALVYHAALRRTGGNAPLAEEIAQSVFAEAARRATALARHPALVGWLYTATRNLTTEAVRRECTRRRHEAETQHMQELMTKADTADWERLRPVIDEALDALGERERDAVLLRFFKGLPYTAIGTTLGISEDAARMRVERALEKLRAQLRRRGVESTGAALTGALAGQSALAAPAGLAGSVAGGAVGALSGSGAAALGALLMRAKFAAGIVSVVAVAIVAVAVIGPKNPPLRSTSSRATAEAGSSRVAVHAVPFAAAAIEGSAAQHSVATPASTGGIEPGSSRGMTVGATPSSAPRSQREARRAGTEIMAGHPAVKQALVDWHVAKVNFQFAPLFAELGLTPEQMARFQELVRGTILFGDWGARGEFLEFEAPRDVPDERIDAELKQLLGAEGVRRYEAFRRSLRPREWVAQLASQLCLTESPLTPAQATALVAVLRDAPYRHDDLSVAREHAATVLSEPQLPALQMLFAQQEQWRESDAAQRQAAERAAEGEQKAGGPASAEDLVGLLTVARNDPAAVEADLAANRPMLAWRFADFCQQNGIVGTQRDALLQNAYRGMAEEREILSAAAVLKLRYDEAPVDGFIRRSDEQYLAAQRALLGDVRAGALNAYEEQAFLRNVATALAGAAVLADAPMSAVQVRQLGDVIVQHTQGPIARRGAAKLEIDWRAIDEAARTVLTGRQHALFVASEAPGIGGGGARFVLRLNQAIHRAVFSEAR